MKKIRLGHVGTYHDHSSAKLACVLKFPEIFEVVGCVAESTEREAALRNTEPYSRVEFMSREELISRGIDAVLVEGFELDLIKEAKFFAERGIHMHIDKPAGGDCNELSELLRMAKAKELVVQFAYMYRYNPAFLDCRRRIAAGELGEIYEVDAIMDTCHNAAKRKWLGNFRGGIQFFLGCHMIDLVYGLQGMPDNIVPFLKSTGFDGVNSADHAFAAFEYKNGISTVRATATEVNGYGRRQLIVCGSEGTYEIEPLENPMRAYLTLKKNSATFEDRKSELSIESLPGSCRYDAMMLDFAAFVSGSGKNPYTFEYELAMHKILMYCCGADIDWRKKTTI